MSESLYSLTFVKELSINQFFEFFREMNMEIEGIDFCYADNHESGQYIEITSGFVDFKMFDFGIELTSNDNIEFFEKLSNSWRNYLFRVFGRPYLKCLTEYMFPGIKVNDIAFVYKED